MLSEITLKNVSRDDVDRVAWWLEDEELSSRWFGHYGCGDPVHRGYDPQHMLEATESEWMHVFDEPHRLIYSIYSEKMEHIGEYLQSYGDRLPDRLSAEHKKIVQALS